LSLKSKSPQIKGGKGGRNRRCRKVGNFKGLNWTDFEVLEGANTKSAIIKEGGAA